MKRVTPSHHVDRIGVHAVAQQVHQRLGWLLRPQEVDYGIDAIIEVVIDGQPTGKLIAAQIKSGPSYFKESNETEITFRGKLAHLDYWLNHDLPVIVVLYDSKHQIAYWQSVTPEHVSKTRKAWRMKIPRNQKLEAAQAASLEAIAAQTERLKAVATEFTCPHCGAELLERVGGESFYEAYACGSLIENDERTRPCPFDPSFPKFDEYELEFHNCSTSTENTWLCIPIPKTGTAKRLRLSSASAATKELAEQALRAQYDRYQTKRGPRY